MPLWWFSGKQIRGLLAEDWVDRISNADPGLEHGARSSGIPSYTLFPSRALGNFNSGTASLRRIPIQVVIFVPESQVLRLPVCRIKIDLGVAHPSEIEI